MQRLALVLIYIKAYGGEGGGGDFHPHVRRTLLVSAHLGSFRFIWIPNSVDTYLYEEEELCLINLKALWGTVALPPLT